MSDSDFRDSRPRCELDPERACNCESAARGPARSTAASFGTGEAAAETIRRELEDARRILGVRPDETAGAAASRVVEESLATGRIYGLHAALNEAGVIAVPEGEEALRAKCLRLGHRAGVPTKHEREVLVRYVLDATWSAARSLCGLDAAVTSAIDDPQVLAETILREGYHSLLRELGADVDKCESLAEMRTRVLLAGADLRSVIELRRTLDDAKRDALVARRESRQQALREVLSAALRPDDPSEVEDRDRTAPEVASSVRLGALLDAAAAVGLPPPAPPRGEDLAEDLVLGALRELRDERARDLLAVLAPVAAELGWSDVGDRDPGATAREVAEECERQIVALREDRDHLACRIARLGAACPDCGHDAHEDHGERRGWECGWCACGHGSHQNAYQRLVAAGERVGGPAGRARRELADVRELVRANPGEATVYATSRALAEAREEGALREARLAAEASSEARRFWAASPPALAVEISPPPGLTPELAAEWVHELGRERGRREAHAALWAHLGLDVAELPEFSDSAEFVRHALPGADDLARRQRGAALGDVWLAAIANLGTDVGTLGPEDPAEVVAAIVDRARSTAHDQLRHNLRELRAEFARFSSATRGEEELTRLALGATPAESLRAAARRVAFEREEARAEARDLAGRSSSALVQEARDRALMDVWSVSGQRGDRPAQAAALGAEVARLSALRALRAFSERAAEGCERWNADAIFLALENLGAAYRRMEAELQCAPEPMVQEHQRGVRVGVLHVVEALEARLPEGEWPRLAVEDRANANALARHSLRVGALLGFRAVAQAARVQVDVPVDATSEDVVRLMRSGWSLRLDQALSRVWSAALGGGPRPIEPERAADEIVEALEERLRAQSSRAVGLRSALELAGADRDGASLDAADEIVETSRDGAAREALHEAWRAAGMSGDVPEFMSAAGVGDAIAARGWRGGLGGAFALLSDRVSVPDDLARVADMDQPALVRALLWLRERLELRGAREVLLRAGVAGADALERDAALAAAAEIAAGRASPRRYSLWEVRWGIHNFSARDRDLAHALAVELGGHVTEMPYVELDGRAWQELDDASAPRRFDARVEDALARDFRVAVDSGDVSSVLRLAREVGAKIRDGVLP
jgi:hypothetical protein